MKKRLKTVVLALVVAAAFAAGVTVSAGHKGGGSTCWTICCDGGFPCISCCKGQACPDLSCP